MDPALIALVTRAIEGAGFEVVQVKVDARRNIRAFVDREVGGVMVQDCTTLTRRIRDVFEADGLDPGSFHIEVLSPGLDRLLVREKDFVRFTGKAINVRLKVKRGERRQFKGTLLGFDPPARFRLQEGAETFLFDLEREVDEVRLVPDVLFPTAAELSQRHQSGRQKKRKKR